MFESQKPPPQMKRNFDTRGVHPELLDKYLRESKVLRLLGIEGDRGGLIQLLRKLDLHAHKEIAGFSAKGRGHSFSSKAEPGPIIGSCRNRQRELFETDPARRRTKLVGPLNRPRRTPKRDPARTRSRRHIRQRGTG